MSLDTFTTEPPYIVPEVAQYLRYSTRTIVDLIHRGDLHAVKIGRLTRITTASSRPILISRPMRNRYRERAAWKA